VENETERVAVPEVDRVKKGYQQRRKIFKRMYESEHSVADANSRAERI
jgi:ferritin